MPSPHPTAVLAKELCVDRELAADHADEVAEEAWEVDWTDENNEEAEDWTVMHVQDALQVVPAGHG